MAMKEHVAAIQFDPAHLAPKSPLQPDFLYRPAGTRREQAFCLLTGQDIRLEPAPGGAAPTLAQGSTGAVPTTASEGRDFCWVAAIADLDSAAAAMDAACTQPGSDAGGRVVGRMSLTGGTLSTLTVGRDRGGLPIPFRFSELGNSANLQSARQVAVASAVAYDVDLYQEDVALVLRSFDGCECRLELSFAGLPMGYTMQILIKNMPLDALLELQPVIQPGTTPSVDEHFAMYYALSQHQPQALWIPDSTRARALNPVCAMGRFRE
jgi:hypothetical protein